MKKTKSRLPAGQKKTKEAVTPPWPGLKAFGLLRDLWEDEAGLSFRKALKGLEKGTPEDLQRARRSYLKLWKILAEDLEFSRRPFSGNGLQDYWLEKWLDHPNAFHRKAELAPYAQLGAALKEAYGAELQLFLKVLRVDWEKIFKPLRAVPSLSGFKSLTGAKNTLAPLSARRELKEILLKSDLPPASMAAQVAAYFHGQGFGLFGRFRAFRWNHAAQALEGVESVDPIRLENLVGYDEQREPLLENIRAFVKGKPANNVLLYGERGTGKSSTVKALLNAHHAEGLRVVEVLSSHLMDLPAILPLLRARPEKFILFVDDLSFEENETGYKGLKAVLEGTLEASPANVILMATSNRRHLVREFFDDRAGGLAKEGEIHGADTVEEKLSLADRFGLVVSFYAPDQETFFKMVDEWAKVEGVKLPSDELHLKAAQWARFNNGRSGRAARQFIQDLKGNS
ncbi:MAG TPA: ATP-binding protein [bacterium]|nr:ATP-binding protein [bacterium]